MKQKITGWINKHPLLFIYGSFLLLSVGVVYLISLQNQQILMGDHYHFHQSRIEGWANSL